MSPSISKAAGEGKGKTFKDLLEWLLGVGFAGFDGVGGGFCGGVIGGV